MTAPGEGEETPELLCRAFLRAAQPIGGKMVMGSVSLVFQALGAVRSCPGHPQGAEPALGHGWELRGSRVLFISSSTAWISKVNCLLWSPLWVLFFPSSAVFIYLFIYLFINLLIHPSPAQGALPRMRRAKYKERGNPCINLPGHFRTLDEFCSAFIAADSSPEDLRMCHGTAALSRALQRHHLGLVGWDTWHRNPIPGHFQMEK